MAINWQDDSVPQEVRDALSQYGSPRASLAGFDMAQRDQIADWILNKYRKLQLRIFQVENYLETHPDDKAARGQLDYWRVAISVSKHLAFLARSDRRRPKGT